MLWEHVQVRRGCKVSQVVMQASYLDSVPLHWIKDRLVHIYRVPTASVAPSVIMQHMWTEVSLLY